MPKRERQFFRNLFLGILCLISFSFCLGLESPLTTWRVGVVVAQTSNPKQLVQQGIERYQAGDYKGAIASWLTALDFYQNNDHAKVAIVLENLARAHQQLGSEKAIAYWEQAIAYYRQANDIHQVGRLLTEQAQTYTSLGQNRQAIALLCGTTSGDCAANSALQIARTLKDRALEAAALGSLGNAYQLRGNYTQALAYLEQGLEIAKQIEIPIYQTSTLNGLGNTYISMAQLSYRRMNSALARGNSKEAGKFKNRALQHDSKALQYFQASLNLAQTRKDRAGEMRSLLNSIPSYRRTQASNADVSLQQAIQLLTQLPDSRDRVYAAIDLANLVQSPNEGNHCQSSELSKAEELLKVASAIARRLSDPRSESFALGKLAQIYECREEYPQALKLTRQAVWAAEQNLNAKDSLYLWEWQSGRILKKQNQSKPEEAIAAYERAVATLEAIRSDILTANRDLQFDFRDTVEPIYRELAELRLGVASDRLELRQQNLGGAIKTIDALKLAQLQNYFGNDCILAALNQESVAKVGAKTAIFSSIVFEERTAILVSLPNGENRSTWIEQDRETLKQQVNEFRRGLERYRDLTYDSQPAQQLYNSIVRPFATDLEQAQIETLVFIQDGILRSVPMAALHDGEKFLVQKYAIATTPSLTLTNPKPLARQQLRALALGVTQAAVVDGRRFPALTNVSQEIGQIQAEIPGTKKLLDQNFTRDRLQQELSKTTYPILHIATHAEFSSEPEDTFLVTGNNAKLTIDDLDTTIRSVSPQSEPVELLILTACQTAVGDDRAALGLAGVALQAGVRSAIASLWFIQDAPTVDLVTKFYANLRNTSMSKAQALQAAQRATIAAGGQYAHPAYWSPLILIGNWL